MRSCQMRSLARGSIASVAAAALVLIGGTVATGAQPTAVVDSQSGEERPEFEGYTGYVGGVDPAAVATDSQTKTEELGPVGDDSDHAPDVPGEEVTSPSDDGADVRLPSAPNPDAVAQLRAAIAADGTARAIVTTTGTIRGDTASDAGALDAERAEAAAAQDHLAATLAGTGATHRLDYEVLPAAVYDLTDEGLDALLADPQVGSVALDGQVSGELASSTGVIDSDLLNTAGVLGNNFDGNTNGGAYGVAIIDSGVDGGHAAFAGRIVSEACFVTDSSCLGGTNTSTAPGSGEECTHSSDCDHGTHVAGIAAGTTFAGGHEGVARGAQIAALKVAQDNPASSRWTAFFSSIDSALNRVITLKATTMPNLVSVNLSIGTNAVFAAGDPACNAVDPTTSTLFGTLQSAGVAVVVAAGNNGSSTGMSFPGCATNAFAIGATTDADVPASFTNSSAGLRWWAPGVSIDAPVPTGTNHGFKDGTSMAAPHVAGAFALLRECVDGNGVPLSNAATAANLDATGVNVTRNGVTRKRINVLDAATRTVNNNDFAFPEVFAGNGPIDDFDFTVCSDTEPGEPGPFSIDNGIWWTWTPATTGTATISTEDSATNVTTFDTTLAVYTGATLAGLSLIASDDDSGTGTRSLTTFPVNGGTTYRIKVDGFAAQNGRLNLHIQNGPPPACFGVAATIVGTSGADTIIGTAGADVIVAGAGNDVVRGLGGNDRICGDAGNDSIAANAGDDFVLGGSGADTIYGSTGNDSLTGNPGSGSNDDLGDRIYGDAGNDFLDGWFGDDILQGGLGNDTLGGFAGVDTVSYVSSATPVSASLTAGTGTGEGSDTFIQVENLTGSAFNDTLVGDAGVNVLIGNAGNDVVRGAAGNDLLRGLAGIDKLYGDANNDRLEGGTEGDYLAGGLGNDVVRGDTGVDAATYATAPAAVTVSLVANTATGGDGSDTLNAIESITGSAFADILRGNVGNNRILAGAGNDRVWGNSGVDALYGGTGNDQILGEAGNDQLLGEAGNDALNGGTNTDSCSGGTGVDTGTSCESSTGIP